MESLVGELRSTLKNLISESTWMDSKTKSAALEKLAKMQNRIGFATRILNETYMTDLLTGVVLRPTTFYQNIKSIERADIRLDIEKLRIPYNSQEQDFPPA